VGVDNSSYQADTFKWSLPLSIFLYSFPSSYMLVSSLLFSSLLFSSLLFSSLLFSSLLFSSLLFSSLLIFEICSYIPRIKMQGFVNETGNTLGVEESKCTTTYEATIYKLGSGDGWTSSQLPINLTKAEYQIDVEIKQSQSGRIHNF
jgi:hypothetical protein